MVNRYYPSCCEKVETKIIKCYCECIYYCETRNNTIDSLDYAIPSKAFTKCINHHSSMREGSKWKAKMCKESMNSQEHKKMKNECRNNTDEPNDYERCVGSGHCHGVVCKHCYRWQCASQLSSRVKELEEKLAEKRCSKFKDPNKRKKCKFGITNHPSA